jgi:hypothetical protein
MNDQQAEEAVLQYLHGDSDEERRFRSLTTLFEMVMKPREPKANSYDLDDEFDTKEELRTLLDAMVQDGLLESDWGPRDYEASYRLTEEGAYQASGFDQYAIETPSSETSPEPSPPLLSEEVGPLDGGEGAALHDTSTTIDSSAWTGLTRVTIDARNARAVSSLIDDALASLAGSHASNFKIMQATAYLKAAKELVEAPEPPSEEVWRLIGRAADLVGLIGLFYTIFVQVLK